MTATAARPAEAPVRGRLGAVTRWRPSSTTTLLILAVVIACLGVAGNVVQVARHGWVLEGDNAAIAINAFDTVHGHFRLVGPPTSAVNYAGIGTFYHPGPMLYWLAALPAGVFGWSAGGFLFFAALVNCAALIGVAVFVRRRAGDLVATGFMAAAALLVWAVGTESPHDIWNPHIAVLPWLLTLVLLWSVLDDDPAALVPLAFTASFVLQDHFGYLPLVGPILLGVLVVLGVRWVRTRRTGLAIDATHRTRWLGHGIVAAVVGTVCWLPVAIQQFTGDPRNVSQLIRYVDADPPDGRQGVSFAAGRFFGFLGSRPLWLSRHLDIFSILREPNALDVVVAVLVVAVAAGLCWYHLRRGRRVIGLLLALCLAGLALLVVSTASLPNGILSSAAPYNYLPWWPVCVLLYAGMAWGGLEILVDRRTHRALPRRPVQVGAVVVALALSVATVAGTDINGDRSTWAFPAIRRINAELRGRLPGHGPYYVVGRGGLAFLSLTNPIVLDLIRHGYDVRIPTDREEFLGTFRRVERRHLAGIILVVSGQEQPPPPPGSKELIRVPAGPGHPATSDTATSYPVVVYLLPPSQLAEVS